jgi:hypothetical protein
MPGWAAAVPPRQTDPRVGAVLQQPAQGIDGNVGGRFGADGWSQPGRDGDAGWSREHEDGERHDVFDLSGLRVSAALRG